MKLKKIMLATFVLLAILTIGAVSASEDIDALAVDDTGDEQVVESSVDEDVVETSAADVDVVEAEGTDDALQASPTAKDFNVTFLVSEVDIDSGDTAVIRFYWPEGVGGYDQVNVDVEGGSRPWFTNLDGKTFTDVTLEELYIFEPGVYNLTVDYNDNMILAKGTLTVAKLFSEKDFIEMYNKTITSPTDYVCNVYDSYGNLNGNVVVLANGTEVYSNTFNGNVQAIRINWNTLTGDLKGLYNVKVTYNRATDGKEYSKQATITFGDDTPVDTRPVVTFKPKVDSIYYGETAVIKVTAEYSYNKVNTTISDPFMLYIRYYDRTIWEWVTVVEKKAYLSKGQTTLRFDGLNSTGYETKDQYLVEVIVNDTDAYKANLNSASFSVWPAQSKIWIDGLGAGESIVMLNGTSVDVVVCTEGALNYTANVEFIQDAVQVNGSVATIFLDEEGYYNLILETVTDANHESASLEVPISVITMDDIVGFEIEDVTYDYGESGTCVVTGTSKVAEAYVNDENAVVKIQANNVTVSGLDAGSYVLSIKALVPPGLAVTKEVNVTVNKVKSSISIAEVEAETGSSISVETVGATNFTATIDGNPAVVEDGAVSLSGVSVGNHTLIVTTVPDKNHLEVSENVTITVTKPHSSIAFEDMTIAFDYGKSGSTGIAVKDGKVGSFSLSDVKGAIVEGAVVKLNETTNKIEVSGLAPGEYVLSIIVVPDEGFLEVTRNITITVSALNSSLELADIEFDYGSSGSTDVNISNGIIGEIEIRDSNGNIVLANITIDGTKITVSGLDAGKYRMSITSNPYQGFLAVTRTANITVNQLATSITPASATVTTSYGTSKNIVVTLKDKNGAVIAGKEVTLVLNGNTYKTTTNGNGQATFATPKTLAVKNNYAATVSFAGDKNYASSSAKVTVSVGKATPKLTAKAKSFKKSVKTKKYTVTLKTDKNAALKNVKVTIKVGKKTYSAKTLSSGKATFKITKLTKKGKYTATVKFAGNSNYKAVTKKVKITVK